jgi:hypothetical protein
MDPVGDTLPTALYTSYTGPVAAYTDSVGADTSNDGHTPTMESAHILQSTRFPIDELLLPPTPPTQSRHHFHVQHIRLGLLPTADTAQCTGEFSLSQF